jgi:hypothetical protein
MLAPSSVTVVVDLTSTLGALTLTETGAEGACRVLANDRWSCRWTSRIDVKRPLKIAPCVS